MLLQVCISFALHRGLVVILNKTVKTARITENLKCTGVKLDQEDMRRLRELETKNHRYVLVSESNETSNKLYQVKRGLSENPSRVISSCVQSGAPARSTCGTPQQTISLR